MSAYHARFWLTIRCRYCGLEVADDIDEHLSALSHDERCPVRYWNEHACTCGSGQ